jgi:hypothetical protein
MHPGRTTLVRSLLARSCLAAALLGVVALIGCGGGGPTLDSAPEDPATCPPPSPGPAFAGHAIQIDVGGNTNNVAAFVIGYEFQSEHEVEVTHLGVRDQNGNGTLDEPLPPEVGLCDVNGALLADVVVPLDTVAESGWFYAEIVPLLLAPERYVMGAVNRRGAGSDQFWYDSSIRTAPGISVIEGRASYGTELRFPDEIIRTQPFAYFGPGFKIRIDALPPTLQLTQPTERAVFQRNDGNVAEVPIEGTVVGHVCRVEARAVARSGLGGQTTDWVVVDFDPAGGIGMLSTSLIVSGGWYDIEVRATGGADSGLRATVERVGVGEVFITAGQSNSANYGDPAQQADDDRVCALDPIMGAWRLADDPQPYATGVRGSPWPELGDLLAAEFDVPVGFLSVGVGATEVGYWDGGGYGRLQTAISALQVYGFRAVLWHQGESDSLSGTSTATYATTLQSIIAKSRVDAGFDVPWGVALASWHPSSTAANEAKVIDGQMLVIADDPLVFQGSSTDSFHLADPTMLGDSVHFNTLGLETHAMQWFDALLPLLR